MTFCTDISTNNVKRRFKSAFFILSFNIRLIPVFCIIDLQDLLSPKA